MQIIGIIIWCVCAFIVLWAMIGYPMLLMVIDRTNHVPNLKKNFSNIPTITVIVVVHNEEKVIGEKLANLISLDYPKDKLSIIVTSDYSTDSTNNIVEHFINEHRDFDIKLHKTIEHKGKTNAQNEAYQLVNSELIVMTDANCYFEVNALKELAACFVNSDIKYVCGSTIYTNANHNRTAESETTYWDLDSKCRDIESRLQTITAGDGNIYACRTSEYKCIPLIECHDSSFPILFALDGGRAVFNPEAISYEKAGESDGDEYKRKVRMNRNLFHNILPSIKILNVFKYRWLTLFWFSHRTCRYLLWCAHFLLLVIAGILATNSWFWSIMLFVQILFYIIACIGIVTKSANKFIKLPAYYTMTIAAQWHGVFNIVTGKSKPTWAKAESTR